MVLDLDIDMKTKHEKKVNCKITFLKDSKIVFVYLKLKNKTFTYTVSTYKRIKPLAYKITICITI